MTTLRLRRSVEAPDLYGSLALESRLLDTGPGADPVLFLWRAPPAVVMGKNQNPWRECNLEVVAEKGLMLARRETGGGSVYHDPGNLNICWAMRRSAYDPDVLHRVLLGALAEAGVEAEVRKGGAVWAEGRKISGCAFGYRRDRVLHHATLLIDADLATLKAALAPPRVRVRTHAVESIPAPVANLSDLRPGLTVNDWSAALERAAARAFGDVEPLSAAWAGDAEVKRLAGHMGSTAWIWHRAPRFQVEVVVEGKPLRFEVHQGRVGKVRWAEAALPVEVDFGPKGFTALDRVLDLPEGSTAASLRVAGWRFLESDPAAKME